MDALELPPDARRPHLAAAATPAKVLQACRKDTLFSDIKTQGKAIVRFYIKEKIVTERYWN